MSYFRVRNPWLNALIGWFGMRALLRGSLFGALVEAHRFQDALDERQQRKIDECTNEARFAAENAGQRGASRDDAIAEAVAAGKACMSKGPLFTGRLTPATTGDPATPPPPKPPNNVARAVVFIVAVVLGAIFAAKIVGGFHG